MATLKGFAALVRPGAKPPRTKDGPRKWVPHAYMKRAVAFLVERGAAALLLDPGLGKTSITYAAIIVLKKIGMFKGVLVVAPRRVAVSTWPREQQEWLDFAGLDVVVLHGDLKGERVQERHDVYVINYEGLPWLVKQGHMDALLNKKWVDILVLDELSKVKHPDSGRHQFIAAFRHKFARCWGLTGSPASNGLLDLFGQAFILDMGKALGIFYTHFRWNFFTPIGDKSGFPVWVPKDGAEELIYDRLKPIALRIPAKGNVKMPELIPNVIKLDLDPKARKVYDQMEHEFFAFMESGSDALVTAATAAAASMKCRQIATGAIYEDKIDPLTGEPRTGNRKWSLIHDNKLEALADLRDELQGQQLMIVYEFGHDLARIREYFKKLKIDVPYIGGGVSDKKALAYEDAWNAHEIQDIVVHPASMAHGLNFQKGNAYNIAFFTLGYDYELYDQIIRRLMRQGNQALRVFAHHFITRDTVEEAALASQRSKRRTQDTLHAALEEYRVRRRSSVPD